MFPMSYVGKISIVSSGKYILINILKKSKNVYLTPKSI